jgi:hypothetical protein
MFRAHGNQAGGQAGNPKEKAACAATSIIMVKDVTHRV